MNVRVHVVGDGKTKATSFTCDACSKKCTAVASLGALSDEHICVDCLRAGVAALEGWRSVPDNREGDHPCFREKDSMGYGPQGHGPCSGDGWFRCRECVEFGPLAGEE